MGNFKEQISFKQITFSIDAIDSCNPTNLETKNK